MIWGKEQSSPLDVHLLTLKIHRAARFLQWAGHIHALHLIAHGMKSEVHGMSNKIMHLN